MIKILHHRPGLLTAYAALSTVMAGCGESKMGPDSQEATPTGGSPANPGGASLLKAAPCLACAEPKCASEASTCSATVGCGENATCLLACSIQGGCAAPCTPSGSSDANAGVAAATYAACAILACPSACTPTTGGTGGSGGQENVTTGQGGSASAQGGAQGTGSGGQTTASGGATPETGGTTSTTGGTTTATGGMTASGGTTTATGGTPIATGGTTVASGGTTSATGGMAPETGGMAPETGGTNAATGGSTTATGGATAATGGSGGTITAAGGTPTATGGSPAGTGGTTASGPNLILDPDFAAVSAYWSATANGGDAATLSCSGGQCCVTNEYDTWFAFSLGYPRSSLQAFALEAGATYTLAFRSRGSSVNSLEVKVGQAVSPYTTIYSGLVTVSSTLAEYSRQFSVTTAESAAGLVFNAELAEYGSICFSGVSLTKN